jgi:nicotinamidase/pyrazinamidase
MKAKTHQSALILVDIQNDFCPSGALAVREGDQIVPIVNELIARFPLVISTQDWHPANHVSFIAQGGPWPPHCVQGTHGAALRADLRADTIAHFFRKASSPDKDDYSEFAGKDEDGRSLDEVLNNYGVTSIYIVGLATDYCVLETVLDGLKYGYEVFAVTDAMRAVNVNPDDGENALRKMRNCGARLVNSREVIDSAGSAAIAS